MKAKWVLQAADRREFQQMQIHLICRESKSSTPTFPEAPRWHLAGFSSTVNLMGGNDKQNSLNVTLSVRKSATRRDRQQEREKDTQNITEKTCGRQVDDELLLENLIGRRKVLQPSRAAMKRECRSRRLSEKVKEGIAPRAGQAHPH